MFVGGGFAGVEAFGETEDMARAALRYYPELDPSELHFVMVEAAPASCRRWATRWAATRSRCCARAAWRCYLDTQPESCIDGHIVLSDGEEFEADTLVWTAGVKPNPLIAIGSADSAPRGM